MAPLSRVALSSLPDVPSFSATQPESTKSSRKKRKIPARSSSQPATKARKKVVEVDESRDLLLKVLEKLTSLDSDVKEVNKKMTEFKEEFLLNALSINSEQKIEKMACDLESIKEKLGHTLQPSELSTQEALVSMDTATEPTVNQTKPDQPTVLPSEVIPDWVKYLNKRKYAFIKHLNNGGKHDIQLGWKNMDPPFIPAEYLPKELRYGESEREYEVRRKQKINDRDANIELLAIRRDEGLAEYGSVDTFITDAINELEATTEVKESLQKEYDDKVKADEDASNKYWATTKTGLLEKPERENGTKIVVTEERVYSKALKKGLENPKDTHHEEDKPGNKWTGAKKNKRRSNQKTGNLLKQPQRGYQKPHFGNPQPHFHPTPYYPPQQPNYYQQPMAPPLLDYQQPVAPLQPRQHYPGDPQQLHQQPRWDCTRPPPVWNQLQVKQPERVPFHWETPTNRWKVLDPNARI